VALMPTLIQLAEKYRHRVDFAAVYITEAHASDEWPIGPNFSTNKQPRALQERLAIATKMVDRLTISVPVYVDCMSNEFEACYAAWPLRMFIISKGKVQWVSQPNSEHFTQPSAALIERCIQGQLA